MVDVSEKGREDVLMSTWRQCINLKVAICCNLFHNRFQLWGFGGVRCLIIAHNDDTYHVLHPENGEKHVT